LNVGKKGKQESRIQAGLILLQKSANGAVRMLSGRRLTSMLKRRFAVTIAWLHGNPKTTAGKTIPDGPGVPETQEGADGGRQRPKRGGCLKESVKSVGFQLIPFIIKSP